MTWPFWLLGGTAWLTIWTWIIASRAVGKEGDALVATFGSLLPAFSVATCLAAFLAVPMRQAAFHKITLWAHHASVLLLFLFLLTAEYLQAEAWFRVRRRCSVRSVAGTFRRLWVLTETTPAPVALTVFLTGLRLMWDSPQTNSPCSVWLFALVLGFSLFFWDGIFGYRPIVRRMWITWKRAAETGAAGGDTFLAPRHLTDTLQLFTHFVSWPLVFVFGLFRLNPGTRLTRPICQIAESLRVLPSGWPEVTTAALLWLVIGIAVSLLRTVFGSHRTFDA